MPATPNVRYLEFATWGCFSFCNPPMEGRVYTLPPSVWAGESLRTTDETCGAPPCVEGLFVCFQQVPSKNSAHPRFFHTCRLANHGRCGAPPCAEGMCGRKGCAEAKNGMWRTPCAEGAFRSPLVAD